ncbi:hypothetical protein GOODEAATRI_031105, partial [Goodea atripinnis]
FEENCLIIRMIVVSDEAVEEQSSNLTFTLSAVSSPADRRNISAEPGQSVTLPCQHPDNYTLIAVEWSRTDLGDKYVLLYRDQQMDKSYQEPSFSDRVDLQDRLMEDGGVSLVLQDVRTYDTGTYECRVVHSGLSEAKLNNGPICTIHLDVAPPPP